MQKRTLKVALLAVLAIVLVMGISGAAQADQTWSDLPDTVTAKYGITDNQVAEISEGYPGGLWRPYSNVSRAQFTKMAVAAFNISLANSALASYTDVPKSNYYYPYVEGAKAAGIVTGTTATTFSPDMKITRQQALAIVARYIAKAQGFDLATMYTADDIAVLLAHFGDAASISPSLRDEVAFAFDMGITTGDDYGNIKPLANLTRIQGAALLIRAQALVPPELWMPARLQLISLDKSEGLIGQMFTVSFLVTTAEGHPAKGVLVDLDALTGAEFYVGNLSRQAAVTDHNGVVSVDIISTEPGTQRIAASVAGVGTVYTSRYWVALDEVYNIEGATAQNNAGVEHPWGVRVVVMGPGPRSTSQSDWYNAIDADFDPEDLDVTDGIDAICEGYVPDDGWTLEHELALAALGYTPRTMAGIDVEWSIYNRADDPSTSADEKVTSVGDIVSVDGAPISPAKTAVGKTDADGYSSITIVSEAIGTTLTKAIAGYADNPYPKQLFDHRTFQDTQQHWYDWDDQPDADALQVKTWIHHTIGDGTPGPITPGYLAANIGEEKTLTLTLVDQFGNPVPGRSVEWTMQGAGFFQTDDKGDTSDIHVAKNNKDFDTTNALGQAKLYVKSYEAGEQIIHAKVRDKGIGGAEGTYATYTAEVQWFDADVITFDDITTTGSYVSDVWKYENEAVATNPVDKPHTFTAHVYGLKLEYEPTPDEPDGQTPYIDSDAAKNAYDGVFDAKDADYFGGVLLVNPHDLYKFVDWSGGGITSIALVGYGSGYTAAPTVTIGPPALAGGVRATAHAVVLVGGVTQIVIDNPGSGYLADSPPSVTFTGGDGDGPGVGVDPIQATAVVSGVSDIVNPDGVWVFRDGVQVSPGGKVLANATPQTVVVAGRTIKLSLVGGYTQYDYDDDGHMELFTGQTGIYLPLEGKKVFFYVENEDTQLEYGASPPRYSNGGPYFDGEPIEITLEGRSITPGEGTPALTDAAGKAEVTIASTQKGPQTIKAVVDWPGNPHNSGARANAYAKKTWVAGNVVAPTDITIEIWYGRGSEAVKIATNKEGVLSNSMGTPLTGRALAYEEDDSGSKVLNSAHWRVHVLDAYGNDLPDYEVVYLLEGINSWLGGTQNAQKTFLPWAYLVDLWDDMDPDITDLNYDQNGNRPDSDEPRPTSDPYGKIVGPGGTKAFFFNQWLGSEKPEYNGHAGIESWWTRTPGMGFLGYHADYIAAGYHHTWPTPYPGPDVLFDGLDGVIDGVYMEPYNYPDWPPYHVGLATDGAKAWTLDSFYDADSRPEVENLQPNLLTGSCIDIQLADAFVQEYALEGNHLKSILRVMVYAPYEGVAAEEDFIWSIQVHQVWEIPVPTTIELDPPTDYAIAGAEDTTLAATVLDQFGEPMPNVDVYFTSKVLEGTVTETFDDTLIDATDDSGNVASSWGKTSGQWGVEEITAWVDNGSLSGLSSNKAIIQWIYDDTQAAPMVVDSLSYLPDLANATAGQSRVVVDPGIAPWGGKTLRVYTNPGTDFIGGATYVTGSGASINTSVTWTSADVLYVGANSDNTDGVPNWLYDEAP